MKGIDQSVLIGELHKVPLPHQKNPAKTIVNVLEKLPLRRTSVSPEKDVAAFFEDYHRLPLEVFEKFSFDEVCKLKHSSSHYMYKTFENLFEQIANYEVVRKIQSSIWRWGYQQGTWNEIVDTYNNIRRFSLDLGPDFEIRLDYSAGFNECGRSKYSRTFLDGVFAFLVYYKKKHVMTIGFSVTKGRRILIQQVQLAHRTRNRFLYKFPTNRMEFVINQFLTYFPKYKLSVVDGQTLIQKNMSSLVAALQSENRLITSAKENLPFLDKEGRIQENKHIHRCMYIQNKINEHLAHMKSDQERIEKFYGNTGSFILTSSSFKANQLDHYQVAA